MHRLLKHDVTCNSATLIDHIWINFSEEINSGVIICNIKDYYLIFSNFKLNHAYNESKLVKLSFRDFSCKNLSFFQQMVTETDWNLVLSSSECPKDLTEKFINTLTILYKKYFPFKVKYISNKRFYKPWLLKAILNSIRNKHKM